MYKGMWLFLNSLASTFLQNSAGFKFVSVPEPGYACPNAAPEVQRGYITCKALSLHTLKVKVPQLKYNIISYIVEPRLTWRHQTITLQKPPRYQLIRTNSMKPYHTWKEQFMKDRCCDEKEVYKEVKFW